jgi:ketosteroid isomerase-like protein
MTSAAAAAANAVVRRWLGPAWSEGDYAVLPECLAPDATIRFLAGGESRPYGPAQAEAHIRAERALFSDYRYTVHRLVVEGDTVVAVATFGGVHDRGPITTRAGVVVPPTGRRTPPPSPPRATASGARRPRAPPPRRLCAAAWRRRSPPRTALLARASRPPSQPVSGGPSRPRRRGGPASRVRSPCSWALGLRGRRSRSAIDRARTGGRRGRLFASVARIAPKGGSEPVACPPRGEERELLTAAQYTSRHDRPGHRPG